MGVDVLNFVIGAIALVASAALSLLLGTLKTLRDSRSDLTHRVTELEDKNRRLLADNVLMKADMDTLARNVRGDSHWEQYGAKIDAHHAEAAGHWEKTEDMLETILDRIPGGDSE